MGTACCARRSGKRDWPVRPGGICARWRRRYARVCAGSAARRGAALTSACSKCVETGEPRAILPAVTAAWPMRFAPAGPTPEFACGW